MKNTMRFSIVFIVIVFTLSCSSSPPLDVAEKLFLDKHIKVQDNSRPYKIINFQKINSYKQNIFGLDTHVMVYEAVVEITSDCYFYEAKGPERMFGQIIKLSIKNPGPYSFDKYESVKKGKMINIQGQLPFVKTEKGWQLAF